jgi:hypothetical protein
MAVMRPWCSESSRLTILGWRLDKGRPFIAVLVCRVWHLLTFWWGRLCVCACVPPAGGCTCTSSFLFNEMKRNVFCVFSKKKNVICMRLLSLNCCRYCARIVRQPVVPDDSPSVNPLIWCLRPLSVLGQVKWCGVYHRNLNFLKYHDRMMVSVMV